MEATDVAEGKRKRKSTVNLNLNKSSAKSKSKYNNKTTKSSVRNIESDSDDPDLWDEWALQVQWQSDVASTSLKKVEESQGKQVELLPDDVTDEDENIGDDADEGFSIWDFDERDDGISLV